MLRPVAPHLVRFAAGVAVLGSFGMASAALFFDLHWTRVLEGHPLTSLEARLMFLDPDQYVHVQGLLDPEARRAVRDREMFAALGLVLLIAPLAAALFYYLVWTLQRLNQLLRLEIFDRLQTLSLRFHADSRVGDAIYRLYQDSAVVTNVIQTLILEPLGQILRFLTAVVVVGCFDPTLAAVLCMIWPPALLLGRWFTPRLRDGFRRAREANSALTSRIQETLSGMRVIKAYGAEAFEQERFEAQSKEAFAAAYRARNLYATLGVGVFWLAGAVLLVTTAAAALQTRDGAGLFAQRLLVTAGFTTWTLGRFNLFKAMAGEGTQGVETLFKLWARAQDVSAGLDRVFALLDLEPEVRERSDARPLEAVERGIAYRSVSFGYRPDRPVLQDVDLEARVGSITAIVGPTGAGKSTLMSLLLRLFDPDRGRVEIDGVDLRELQLASLRSQISIALQENLLFGASVRENIRYAAPAAPDAAVRAAARVACADGFIQTLPAGYDTLLGDRGAKLSTGEKQRLSIARAVMKDAPVLILDEPTASLDAETEFQVLKNLAAWGHDRVIFLITHRLSSLRHANKILFLADGRVVQCGSHDDLFRRGGAYRDLWLRDANPRPTRLSGVSP